MDKLLKICNNWKSFHNDIEVIKYNLTKNKYSLSLIKKVIKKYLYCKFSTNHNQSKDVLMFITQLTIYQQNFRSYQNQTLKTLQIILQRKIQQ